ncbi:hypothetical protein [Hoeflea sp. TYP-13]|uniref:hypothetical protein n=1 Tax=Hoeflea sp. TYP-13 TaxID=3230023 RepID=UPI0034C5D3EA
MPEGVWLFLAVIVAGGVLFVYLRWRRRSAVPSGAIEDAGSAILVFSQAYPELPIRDVIITKDKECAFLRLADGKVGFVQQSARHASARLLEPESMTIGQSAGDETISVNFPGSGHADGQFVFDTVHDAAEVSLWLCGEFASVASDQPEDDDEGGSDRQ